MYIYVYMNICSYRLLQSTSSFSICSNLFHIDKLVCVRLYADMPFSVVMCPWPSGRGVPPRPSQTGLLQSTSSGVSLMSKASFQVPGRPLSLVYIINVCIVLSTTFQSSSWLIITASLGASRRPPGSRPTIGCQHSAHHRQMLASRPPAAAGCWPQPVACWSPDGCRLPAAAAM